MNHINYITLGLLLIGAHAIGDYALQSEYIAREKTKSLYVLFIHAMIWTTVIVYMWAVCGYSLNPYQILVILFIPHFIMDYCKAQSKWFPKLIKNPKVQLTIDQSFHYMQLITLIYFTAK